MTIKLVGALPPELKDRGCKPGDKFNAEPSETSSLGAVHFKTIVDGELQICTVWPENYKKI